MSLELRDLSICEVSTRVYVYMMALNMLDFSSLRTLSMFCKSCCEGSTAVLVHFSWGTR
jgi:hypothetical protein